MGNLTRDPELRSTPGGQQVASFSVATNRVWNDPSGERKEAVEYHEIVAWGKLGELAAQYLAKGRKVMVIGRLQTRQWDAQDGSKRQRTEIVATDVNFLDARGEAGAQSAAPAPAQRSNNSPKSDDVVISDLDSDSSINLDDIPF
ncbi:single-stranded DNA-binding protein [Candidatus Saccharibacteria bacterium]|nr:single-stranded DNA-binding protein [Candidatus Saccharibacteria bacterium]